MKPEDIQWVRKQFKNNKVWVAADASGQPVVEKNKALIKYQLDQPHQYWVHYHAIKDITTDLESQEAIKPERTPQNRSQRKKKQEGLQPDEDAGPVITIYTDGASSGNPGPSGIGVVMEYGGQTREISKYIGISTNNIAELTAVQTALASLKRTDLPVRIYTDSSYVCGLLVSGWRAQKNVALVNAIRERMTQFTNVKIIKVAGHKGIPGNERADQLATGAIASQEKA